LVGLWAIPSFAALIVDCSGLNLNQLTTGTVSECSVQDKVFSNFQWSSTVAASSVVLADDTDPGYPGASNVNVGIGLSGPFGLTAGAASIDLNLSYTVTVSDPNYLIDDASLFLSGVDFHGGTGSLSGSEDWCGGASISSGCIGGQHLHAGISVSDPQTSALFHVTFSTPVSFVTVTKDIQVHSDPTVATDFSRMDQTFSQTIQGTPEPVSMVLGGVGLCVLGLVGRKRKKA
jgi:hypothetical protein